MGFAHAWIEDVFSRLVLVAVVALLALGAYELSRLRQEVQELSNAVAALKADAPATEPNVADVDEDADEDDQNCNDENAAAEDDEPDLLYERAQDAYVQGKYVDAMRLSEQLLETQPDRGWRVLGASACFLEDRAHALKAYKHLDPPGRSFLKYVCSRHQITLQ